MSKAQEHAFVLMIGTAPSAEMDVLGRACGRTIRTVKWDQAIRLPDDRPRLTVLLISESDQIIHFEDTVAITEEGPQVLSRPE